MDFNARFYKRSVCDVVSFIGYYFTWSDSNEVTTITPLFTVRTDGVSTTTWDSGDW